MHIYQDKRTDLYYVSFIDIKGKRVRRPLGTRNKSAAIIKAAEIIDNKKAADALETSISIFLIKYRDYLRKSIKPQTAKIFEAAWRKLTNLKTINAVSDITPTLLEDLQLSLKDKKAGHAGINRSIRALRIAMRYAERNRMAKPQDWYSLEPLGENKKRMEYHTIQELQQILALCPSADWKLAVLLGCQAGLRRGEVAALQWKDIEFNANRIYVAPQKTNNFRHVPMTPSLREALESAKKAATSQYVVNMGNETSRNSKDFITAYYSRFTAGLPFRCFFHKLRHTFASHLVQAGVPLYHVSQLMGHSSIKMTEIYAHLSQDNLADGIKSLPKI